MAAASQMSMDLPSRYQPIDSLVMLGGFGSVIRVRDIYLDRVVLFKYMQDAKNNAQLLNEIQNLSRARSRHVVEIYDVIRTQDGSICGIIIEYLTGRDYLDFHNEAIGNIKEYLKILFQISSALNDLHRFKIVHRDLKLDNLKSSSSGILKLFDFGISSCEEDYITRNNRGTFNYAAPELYLPGALIRPEMDIYAFGVCAWALASPILPTSLRERPPQKTSKAPSIGSIFGGKLPIKVVELIDCCLNPFPGARPTAEKLFSELATYLTQGLHRGIFVRSNSTIFELSQAKDNVRIKIGTLGDIRVIYNGVAFIIDSVSGDVFINNRVATAGMELHDACLLTFGEMDLGAHREWVTFFSSHPEVVL